MKKVSLLFLLLMGCTALLQAGVRGQLRQGGKLYQNEKYGSAINAYQQILKNNPQNQRALFNVGDAYYRLNEYTQAQESYKQAASLPGDYAQSAQYNLGNAYYKAGDKEKAIEAYKKAILQDPKDKQAIHNLQLIIKEKQDNQDKNKNNNQNQNPKSDNRDSQDQQNQGQNPQDQQENQPQNKSNQLSQQDADRVMSMAKENENRPGASRRQDMEQTVEKDW